MGLDLDVCVLTQGTNKEGNYRTKVALISLLLERVAIYRLYQIRCLVGKDADLENYTISEKPMHRFETWF